MRLVSAIVALVVSARSARADEGFMHRLADAVAARLDQAAASHGPKLTPPTPVPVTWKEKRIGVFDLSGPVIALGAADLDGDGKAELYAVTPYEVVAFALGPRVRELGRVAFSGEPAVPAPRDAVGSIIVDGNALVASASGWAKSMRVRWRGKTLIGDAGEAGFLLCTGAYAQLVSGRDYFAGSFYGRRCRGDLVDPQGYPLHATAQLSLKDKLEVSVERCTPGGGGCDAPVQQMFYEVGFAFDIADVDRDGRPEVIFAQASAPGDPDYIRVVTFGGDVRKPAFHHKFNGGIAGIALVDNPGGPVEVVVAVRFVGSKHVELWRLD